MGIGNWIDLDASIIERVYDKWNDDDDDGNWIGNARGEEKSAFPCTAVDLWVEPLIAWGCWYGRKFSCKLIYSLFLSTLERKVLMLIDPRNFADRENEDG
jgi:hypothetical protein